MARTDPTVYMKLPPEIKEQLEIAARDRHRSLTSEIVARLADSLANDEKLREVFATLDGERAALRHARERLAEETKQVGQFSKSQRSLLVLLSGFVDMAVEELPPSDDAAVNEGRQLMKKFARTVLEKSEEDADVLMHEFSAQVLAGMRSAVSRGSKPAPAGKSRVTKASSK